jgi:putative membrane protein
MIDWTHWHNEPILIGGLVVLGWLWAVLAGPLRARLAPAGTPFPRRQAWYFYSSLVLFYLVVGSPLDQIGERFLFSAHMGQHLVIMYPAPLLLLLGLPYWMVDAVIGHRFLRRPLRWFFSPVICGGLSSLVIGVWHAPWLYEWALQDKLVHVLEHLMFFLAAAHFWWPLYSPSRAFPPITYAGQMLYLLAVELAMTPLFAYVTFSPDILYPTYAYAPRLIPDFTPANDQLLAGVMMKTASMIVSLTAFGVTFYRWAQTNERTNAK